MVYQALYRVWRSQRFSDIVGQKTVTQTLKNALSQNKTSHAYLFTGPRGTGKTSAAKIFAKAINCPNQVDGEPCNQCDTCIAITEGRLNDVIEIDAASNNGVDEIREIREKVKYAPTQAAYKVYIIDEVHMLSTGAFNALLKTLEEPPKNVLFILATTEVHKIPATIISRTQRFDFKRISTEDIVEHLGYVLKDMEKEYEDQSLYIIARAAEGGMRDALSLLDQALSFSDGVLKNEDALQVTGSLTNDMMDDYLLACTANKVEEALQKVQAILAEGKEGSRFIEDILFYCRDLLIYKQAPDYLLSERGFASESFKELAGKLSTEQIYAYIQLLSETQQQLKLATHVSIYLEVVTVKLASAKPTSSTDRLEVGSVNNQETDDSVISQLKDQLSQLKKEVKELKTKGVSTNQSGKSTNNKPQSKPSSYRVPKELVYQVLQVATRERLRQAKDVWGDLLQFLSVTQRAMLKASEPVAASDKGLVIAFDYEIVCQRANDDDALKETITNSLERLIQLPLGAVFIPKDSWGPLRRDYLNEHQADSEQIKPEQTEGMALEPEETEKKLVDEAIALFGEEAVEVTNE